MRCCLDRESILAMIRNMARIALLLLLTAAGLWLAGGSWRVLALAGAAVLASRWDGYRAGCCAGSRIGFERAGALLLGEPAARGCGTDQP